MNNQMITGLNPVLAWKVVSSNFTVSLYLATTANVPLSKAWINLPGVRLVVGIMEKEHTSSVSLF